MIYGVVEDLIQAGVSKYQEKVRQGYAVGLLIGGENDATAKALDAYMPTEPVDAESAMDMNFENMDLEDLSFEAIMGKIAGARQANKKKEATIAGRIASYTPVGNRAQAVSRGNLFEDESGPPGGLNRPGMRRQMSAATQALLDDAEDISLDDLI